MPETKHSEGTMDALRAAAAALGSVFSAIATACVTMFNLEELSLMTEVVAARAAAREEQRQ